MSIDKAQAAFVASEGAIKTKKIDDVIHQFGYDAIDETVALLQKISVESVEEQFNNRLEIVDVLSNLKALGSNMTRVLTMKQVIYDRVIEKGHDDLDAEMLSDIFVGLIIRSIIENKELFI